MSTVQDLLRNNNFLTTALAVGSGGFFKSAVQSAMDDVLLPLLTFKLSNLSLKNLVKALFELVLSIVLSYKMMTGVTKIITALDKIECLGLDCMHKIQDDSENKVRRE